MMTVKERAKTMIDDMPDDVSIEEVLKELAFQPMIDCGLEDSEQQRILSDAEMELDNLLKQS